MSARDTDTPRPVRKTESPFLIRVLEVLLVSLLLSILIEWFCMAFIWEYQGSEHSEMMLERELSFLDKDFKENITGSSASSLILTYVGGAYYYIFQWTHLEDFLTFIGDSIGLTDYVVSMKFVFLLFLVRVGILIFSLPVFVLFAIAGLTSGFALRDIRRWSGGREYGSVYHTTKRLAPKAMIATWVIYLASPVSIHPNLIILPCAVFFGLNILILCASFKKYL